MALPPSASGAAYAALDIFCALPPPATEVQHNFHNAAAAISVRLSLTDIGTPAISAETTMLPFGLQHDIQAYKPCKAGALYRPCEAACNP